MAEFGVCCLSGGGVAVNNGPCEAAGSCFAWPVVLLERGNGRVGNVAESFWEQGGKVDVRNGTANNQHRAANIAGFFCGFAAFFQRFLGGAAIPANLNFFAGVHD